MTAGHAWKVRNGRIVGSVLTAGGVAHVWGPGVGGGRSDVVVTA